MFSSSDDSEEESQGSPSRNKKIYRPRINFNDLSDAVFIEKFRLRRGEAENLITMLSPHLPNKERNKAISPPQQILTALHFLGTGTFYHAVADMHGLSKASVCRIVRRVVTVIVDKIFKNAVRWPTDTTIIASEFMRKGGFPSVCELVDGTLINIEAPTQNEEHFVDRHGNHSLNVMMICGPNHHFYAVNAAWPGSVHDARVLRNSVVSRAFESGWRPFPGAVILGNVSNYPK